ncbi:MAG TPA: hypothetical protein VFJ74_10840 [Gemmatimonadaceae bacterium]|nr:hypothetical protein [Gemmatimonadaceae bacterium]
MRFETTSIRRPATASRWTTAATAAAMLCTAAAASIAAPRAARAQNDSSAAARSTDPRVGLGAGYENAKEAARSMRLVAHRDRPDAFVNKADLGDFGYINGDLAFKGKYAFQGGYNGLQVWDLSSWSEPKLVAGIVCPGGQGDVSVYRNLLFSSVEETRGRNDCGTQAITDTVSKDRFRGVRIYDITDVAHPRQITTVQTCRGSHTHTLVTDPKDTKNVYIYVSGTSPVRPGAELAGCSGKSPEEDPNTSLFRIEVIRVPLARPQDAKIVSMPRVFADSAGNIAGLAKGGAHGEGTQETAETNQCHDITAYSQLGLAAGACSGNGILLDIRNPANPKRVAAVADPNFAYWHSATFSNDGKQLLFSDEWGGGMAAHCLATDRPQWGADAIFKLSGHTLTPAGYYKLPAPQTAQENCVAHDGGLVPIPGRDVMVQAWYQGGISVFDFTDAAHPQEIAFFDRGPLDSTKLVLGGFWSAYWYNGHVVASDLARGLDVLELTPGENLTQNEIDAAKLVHWDYLNPQNQTRIVWPAKFVVARAYLDQLTRGQGLASDRTTKIAADLDAAEKLTGARRRSALTRLAAQLDRDAKNASDAAKVRALAATVRGIAKAK